MSDLRKEAQDPTTPPERLAELAQLEGDRGDIDSDAGWCREYVAANINTPLATLQELAADMNDCMARRNAANNPALDEATLWLMIEDKDDLTADAARMRLRLGPKPRPNTWSRAVVIDPKTGRLIRL